MDLRKAINILESAISFSQLGACGKAWQTLKSFVSEQTAHNNAITKFCPHHSSNKQCIWGLRGCCNVAPCKVRPELRK